MKVWELIAALSELPAGADISASTLVTTSDLYEVVSSDDGVDYYNICKKVEEVEEVDSMRVMIYM